MLRSDLLTVHKLFVRPHVDYGDVIYDHAYNELLYLKLGLYQYDASLAITKKIKA